jgi:hypothetical protein
VAHLENVPLEALRPASTGGTCPQFDTKQHPGSRQMMPKRLWISRQRKNPNMGHYFGYKNPILLFSRKTFSISLSTILATQIVFLYASSQEELCFGSEFNPELQLHCHTYFGLWTHKREHRVKVHGSSGSFVAPDKASRLLNLRYVRGNEQDYTCRQSGHFQSRDSQDSGN